MQEAIDDHIAWLLTFNPSDPSLTNARQRNDPNFRETLYKTDEILKKLSSKLQDQSLPWFSPRYIGHMNSDTLMVSSLAYVMAMMYNPNNCAEEASPVTTEMEVEAGRDLCELFGYNHQQAWGHITSGCTVANYEGLWLARNLKALPMATAAHPEASQFTAGMSEKKPQNMPVREILDLISKLEGAKLLHQVNDTGIRNKGVNPASLGKVLIPRSKHYSWLKAMDILGLGHDQIVPIDVDSNYRSDMNSLRSSVEQLIAEGTPILAVITVVGTTEEGAIDPVHEVLAIRDACEKEHGVSFYVHCDAAYGGYVRSMFIDEESKFLQYDDLIARYRKQDLIPEGVTWPKRDVYEGFKAMTGVDSITVDPHKSGFIPYSAGAITYRDKRILKLLSYHAAYVTSSETDDVQLGPSVMEGSKAGATAAAVWATHRTVSLDLAGYGPVIGHGIATADWITKKLSDLQFQCGERQTKAHLLMEPDYNMVNFGFKEVGNNSLADYNKLNENFYEESSFISGRTYHKNFMTSSTSLTREEYGDAPITFVESMGISRQEWDQLESVYILRAAVMTQFLRERDVFEDYWNDIASEFESIIAKILK
ncbi:MAG: pyridoxal-dependent decarboxylase [Synechococcus sp.]|nr:pyridoxal-dependent decarboxylase [Synechococcus sp.]